MKSLENDQWVEESKQEEIDKYTQIFKADAKKDMRITIRVSI